MRRSTGFTLIEVMVTVAIVAILAAIAIPSYRDYVLRGKLTEALSALSTQRVNMERYFQDNRTYTNACQLNTVAPLPVTTNFTYVCAISAAGVVPSTYTITATGIGSMVGFVYTMTEANVRATTGLPADWVGVGNNCWVTKKDGSC